MTPRLICLGLEWAWLLLGLAGLAAAALLVSKAVRLEALERRLERLPPPVPFAALGLALPLALVAFKWAQFQTFQLLWDSATMANIVWNAAHGAGLTSSLMGDKSCLAVHFAFTVALLAPLMRLWPSIFVLTAAHGAALGSSILGAYLLGKKLGRSALIGWLAALLALSSPFFHGLAISVIDNSIFAFPLFIWAAYFWESGRKGPAVLCGLLLLTTREQIPFLVFGFGLFAFFHAPAKRRGALTLMAGAALLFAAELAVMRQASGDWADYGPNWIMYQELGGAPSGVLATALTRPWLFLLHLIYPAAKLKTVLETFFAAAFLPLASGWAALPALCAWLPQQLAGAEFDYHSLHGHYGAIVAGPLLWSAVRGLCRLRERWKDERRRALLASWVLVACAVPLLSIGAFVPPERSMPKSWETAVPHAARFIPPEASLWCDEYLAPHFALRRRIRALPRVGGYRFFETALFVPDRVLLSTYWIRIAEPAERDRIFAFLKRRGFIKTFEEADLVVFANPTVFSHQAPVEPIRL